MRRSRRSSARNRTSGFACSAPDRFASNCTSGYSTRNHDIRRKVRSRLLDNNASERSLHRVALGRKNYLFVGDVEAGSSIAGLYTLVATCEARGINPFLADVIPCVQDHPKRRLDGLLPDPWARTHAGA